MTIAEEQRHDSLILVAALLFATTAWAMDAPAPASGTMPAVPSSSCSKPEYPGRLASDVRRRSFNRAYKAYAECIKTYVESTTNLANASVNAGNKAIEEYNAVTKAIQAQIDAGKK